MQTGVTVSRVCHQVVRVIDPTIPAQRKRQCLKFLLETIMYLTLKHESFCFYFFGGHKKKKKENKTRRLPTL